MSTFLYGNRYSNIPLTIVREYSASTFWNKPDGLKEILVICVGAGGGGGSGGRSTAARRGGAGGGGGSMKYLRISASALTATTYSITIGAGGAGGHGNGRQGRRGDQGDGIAVVDLDRSQVEQDDPNGVTHRNLPSGRWR